MKTVNVETLLPKIIPFVSGCNDTIAKIVLADAARTFARETDVITETQGFDIADAPEYGRIPEFAVDKENFLPLHFVARNEDKVNKLVYLTYSLLPTASLMPEAVISRHHEAITSQALFMLYSMPGKPWTAPDMAQLYLQKYRIAAGDAMRDNNTGGAVFDQYMICGEPGDGGFIGAQNISATVIGTDTSDGDITPNTVLAGYVGYAKGEKVVGNIRSVTASLNKNIFTVPMGYVGTPVTLSIPEVTATLNKNTATVPVGYIGEEQKLTVPVANITNDGEYVTVPVGYVESERKFKVGGNTGVNVDFVTATASDILAGKIGSDKEGNPVYGTIATVTASKSGNVVTVPKGYIETAQTLTIDAAKTATVSGNVVTIYPGYTATQYTATIPKATSSVSGNVVTIPAGYHDATTKTVAEAGQTTVSGNVVTTPVGYVKSERKTTVGTAKGAETITPGVSDRTIAAETYLSGALTVKGDANLISENIAEGKEIFGIAGSFKGGGAKFYKCRAVHGNSKTWDGYEVTFDSRGIADISTELTTGLTYGAIAPLRQNIYSADGVRQVRGAMISGSLPTPCYYVSGETPGGNIWASDVAPIGDGDSKRLVSGGAGGDYTNYIDGVYKVLPGFPESASGHDWAFSLWQDGTMAGQTSYSAQLLWVGRENQLRFIYDQASFDGGSTWQAFSPLFSRPAGWHNLVISYKSSERKYTVYINGGLYAEFTEATAVNRLFDQFRYIGTNNIGYSHIYIFSEQITAEQAKLLAKQRWIFEGLKLTGLDDVYNADYGMNVSPNGTLTESGTANGKPKYYVSDPEMMMTTCNIEYNGSQWEIFGYEYDENWNQIKKVYAYGTGGNDPSEAEWTANGYGVPTVEAKYANGI